MLLLFKPQKVIKMKKHATLWMRNLTNWPIQVRTAQKRNSTETTVPTPTCALTLSKRRKSIVATFLCIFKKILTDNAIL